MKLRTKLGIWWGLSQLWWTGRLRVHWSWKKPHWIFELTP